MLSDAVAVYLESVSERAFDEPLMALLRARGFTSVRLVHGAREFGKDVIAQRDGEHRLIAEAILQRDPEAAEAAMRAHLFSVQRQITERSNGGAVAA